MMPIHSLLPRPQEFTWLRGLGWSYYDFVSLKALDFWLWGVLEHMDVFTDGAMPIQAWQCEPEATQSFARAFEVTAGQSRT